jgi:glucose/arabinose dehydrogenase
VTDRFSRRSNSLAVAVAWLLVAAPRAQAQATLPTGYGDALIVGGLSSPASMAFLPDGRLLVVEQTSARVRLIVNGALAPTDPVVTVPNVRTTGGEQGLLGIAVDPEWPTRPYLYVQYDYSLTPNIRISRYTVGGDVGFTGNGALTIDPATRYDILTDLPDNADVHNGGTLRFGPEGMLYSSLGDDATGCPAQDLSTLVGKIIRLDVWHLPAGGGGPPAKSLITPPDNPFLANPNDNARLVCYSGLRNPFRFAIDYFTGAVAIGDVGEVTQEEVDYVSVVGSNFEWPVREGAVAGPMSCSGLDMTYFTEPIYAYAHTTRMAIICGPVYRDVYGSPNPFPRSYEGDIFFSDYYLGWLHRLHLTGNTWALASPVPGQPNATDWATGLAHVSDYLQGPDGALWYCSQSNAAFGANTGQIRRIYVVAPVAVDPVPPMDAAAVASLRAPYPSPARGAATLSFVLARPARVSLGLYDLTGRRVRGLLDGAPYPAGAHAEMWDGRDGDGARVPAGVYFVRFEAAGVRELRRFALVR